MARTRIENLPKDMTIGKEEMKKVLGGVVYIPEKLGPYPDELERERRERLQEWPDFVVTDPITGQSVEI